MRLFGKVDGTVNRFDRAGWLTGPFDLSFREVVLADGDSASLPTRRTTAAMDTRRTTAGLDGRRETASLDTRRTTARVGTRRRTGKLDERP